MENDCQSVELQSATEFAVVMFQKLSALLFVLATCSGSPVAPRIIGGTDADITDFPYIVSVEWLGDHWCGGVIITADWALTDAWCTPEPFNITEFTVRSGSAVLADGTLHAVRQWIRHPLNDVVNNTYDFALFQVDPPFQFGEIVAAVSLPEQNQTTPEGAVALIAGWGESIISPDWTTEHLQFAETVVFSELECANYLTSNFSESKLCAQDPNGQVSHCWRDEGGPLVIDGTLFGIIQWPLLCGASFQVQLYSRVASVRDWIDTTVVAGSTN